MEYNCTRGDIVTYSYVYRSIKNTGVKSAWAKKAHRTSNKKLNEFLGNNNILSYNEEPSSSMPFMTTEHMTCFEMWVVSSSLDISVSLMSKFVLHL
jgi:hypothetical protein